MTVRQQWILVAAIVTVLGGALFASTRVLGGTLRPVAVGTAAPDFHAITLDDIPIARSINDYRGQVVLLNVWATWCGPCIVEMPSMEALHRSFGTAGLRIVAVSVDEPGAAEKIRDFQRQHGLTFEILHDTAGAIQQSYQSNGVPETYLIGTDGVIRKRVLGASNWNSAANRALVASLLGVAVPDESDSPVSSDSARGTPPAR